MDKFDLVKFDCGCNAWDNECTNNGRIELQNRFKGKSISKKNIVNIIKNTPFMSNNTMPQSVEMIQYFPENGYAKVKCLYNAEHKWGTTVNLHWNVAKVNQADYDSLLEKYNALEKRLATLEKLLLK